MWTVDHGLILTSMLILGIHDILESFLMNLISFFEGSATRKNHLWISNQKDFFPYFRLRISLGAYEISDPLSFCNT